MAGRRIKGFLYGAGTQPPVKVYDGTRLVVGSASPGTAKRLLTYNCSGRLIVDVKLPAACLSFP